MRSRLSDPKLDAGNSSKVRREEETPLKFLFMQCLTSDAHCGGVPDRLKSSVPFRLRRTIAYESKCMLLIYWNRPVQLEEFLVPPRGGIDWRVVPPWMVPQIEYPDTKKAADLFIDWNFLGKGARTDDLTLERSRFQDSLGGQHDQYDVFRLTEGETDFAGFFHEVWKRSFNSSPPPPVRTTLESDMQRPGLVPGQYVATHLRALHAMIKDRPDKIQRNWTQNALNCATELCPQKKNFFCERFDECDILCQRIRCRTKSYRCYPTPKPIPPHPFTLTGPRSGVKFRTFTIPSSISKLWARQTAYPTTKVDTTCWAYFSRNSFCGVRQDAMDEQDSYHFSTLQDTTDTAFE